MLFSGGATIGTGIGGIVIGQMLIPIPVIGAFIGGIVGSFIGSLTSSSILSLI